MSCGNKEYELEPGDITLFNPGQNHACLPISNLTMNYYGLNISPLVMEKLVEEITGTAYLPSLRSRWCLTQSFTVTSITSTK